MPRRLPLVLALLLLVLAALQWWLRAQVDDVPAAPDETADAASPVEVTPDEAGHEGVLAPPELSIPEYVPEPVTERPRIPIEFAPPEVPLELAAPDVGGAVEGAAARRDASP